MLFLSSRVSHILGGGRIKIIQILLFPTKSHWVAPKYYSCWISTGHSRTSSITAPQLSDHNWPSGRNFGSTDSTGKLVWTWASLWLSQSQCQPVCVMYWSSVSVLVQCWLCNVNNYIFFFSRLTQSLHLLLFWNDVGHSSPSPPPQPHNQTTNTQLFFFCLSPLCGANPPFARRASSCCKPHHALYTFASFHPSDFFFFAELSDSWKASKTKWEHKAKVGLLSFS